MTSKESPFEYAIRILRLYPTSTMTRLRLSIKQIYRNCTNSEIDKAISDAKVVVENE